MLLAGGVARHLRSDGLSDGFGAARWRDSLVIGFPRKVDSSARNPNTPAGRCGGIVDPAPVNSALQRPSGQARTRGCIIRPKFYFSRIGLQQSSW